jgi:hypothetical protein
VRHCGSLWPGSDRAGCPGNGESKPQPGHVEGRGSSLPDPNPWPCPGAASIGSAPGHSGGGCHATPCHQWWRRSYFPECPRIALRRPEPCHRGAWRSNARSAADGNVAGRLHWQFHTSAVADPIARHLGSHVSAPGDANPCAGTDAIADVDLCPRTDAVADLDAHSNVLSRCWPNFAADVDADVDANGHAHADANRFADSHAHLRPGSHAPTPKADRLFLQSRWKL